MNQRAAFTETLALATERGMPEMYGNTLGLAHMRSMQERIDVPALFSEAKLGRWLGWAQCAVVAAGCATLDDMKRLNMKWSDQ